MLFYWQLLGSSSFRRVVDEWGWDFGILRLKNRHNRNKQFRLFAGWALYVKHGQIPSRGVSISIQDLLFPFFLNAVSLTWLENLIWFEFSRNARLGFERLHGKPNFPSFVLSEDKKRTTGVGVIISTHSFSHSFPSLQEEGGYSVAFKTLQHGWLGGSFD